MYICIYLYLFENLVNLLIIVIAICKYNSFFSVWILTFDAILIFLKIKILFLKSYYSFWKILFNIYILCLHSENDINWINNLLKNEREKNE